MKSTRSFATSALAGTIVALMIATGAAPSLSPIGRNVAHSYRSAIQAYDRARTWGVIMRWWVDPEYVPTIRDGEASSNLEDVSQMRAMGGRER
jgi:hypothetical protein